MFILDFFLTLSYSCKYMYIDRDIYWYCNDNSNNSDDDNDGGDDDDGDRLAATSQKSEMVEQVYLFPYF